MSNYIGTVSDLLLESSCFSDMHKDCYGFRPRGAAWPKTIWDAEKQMDRMQEEMFSPERVEEDRRYYMGTQLISENGQRFSFEGDNYGEIHFIANDCGDLITCRVAIATAKKRGWGIVEAYNYLQYCS